MTSRVVVLVDMDCFYVQVEERHHPIKGVPAAVVQYNAWRGGGIIAVNYEARASGVKRGMRGDEAKSKCPDIHLVTVPVNRGKADLTKYRDAGKEVIQVLSDFTERIERASIDEAYLDLTEEVKVRLGQVGSPRVTIDDLSSTWVVGSEKESEDQTGTRENGIKEWLSSVYEDQDDDSNTPPGPDHPHWDALRLVCAAKICEEMRRAVLEQTGFKCSAGIAHNKILAKLTCGLHKPNQQTVMPQGSVGGLWATMPVGKVRNLGGKLGDSVTEDMGCVTMADVAALSLPQLYGRFDDKTAQWLYNLGQGIDHELVTSRQLAKSIGCGKNFNGGEILNTREKVEKWTRSLVDELSERLEDDQKSNKRVARTLTVGVSLAGRSRDSSSSLSRSCPLPTYASERITRLALSLIRNTNTASLKDPAWKPSIKNISLSASKFEDWEGASSGNIEAMFKKAAALNNSLVNDKSEVSFRDDCLGLSTHLASKTNRDKLYEQNCVNHNGETSSYKSADDANDVNNQSNTPSRSADNINGTTDKAPGNSFFKNFILKRQMETEHKRNSEQCNGTVSKDNSSHHLEPAEESDSEDDNDKSAEECDSDHSEPAHESDSDTDMDGDDGERNLDLLISCLESEEANNHSENETDETVSDNRVINGVNDSKIPSDEGKANKDKAKETSISLSPDLFSSEGSMEARDLPKLEENKEDSNEVSSLAPNVSSSKTAAIRQNQSTDKENVNANLNAKSKIPIGEPGTSCNVSVYELFPDLDDIDISVLAILPKDLKIKVEKELARYKAQKASKRSNSLNVEKVSTKHRNFKSSNNSDSFQVEKDLTIHRASKTDDKSGILRYVQKSPRKGVAGVKSSGTNIGDPSLPGPSNWRDLKNDKNRESADKVISETERDSEQVHENGNLSRNGVVDNENKCTENVRCNASKNGARCAHKEENEGEEGYMGSSQGSESDMMDCEECGERVSAFKFPEHIDFHVALKLQSDLRREEGQALGSPNVRTGKVEGKGGPGRKRGRPSKNNTSSGKMQKIDRFFSK